MRKNTIIRGSGGKPGLVHGKGGNSLVEFTGRPPTSPQNKAAAKDAPDPFTTGAPNTEEENGKKEWVPWGTDDNFPRSIVPLIRKSTVARSALQMLTKAMYGQELFTFKVTGYNEKGQKIIEHAPCPEWETAIAQSNFDAVRLGIIQDYAWWGWCTPVIRFNGNKTKVWGFDYHKTANCRMAPMKDGRIPKIYVSSNFPNVPVKECEELSVIDFIRYPDQIQEIKENTSDFLYIMPQFWPDIINDYYPVAYWDSARSSGHIDISTSIPAYKKALFKNQMSLKYEIQIPWEWIQEMHPTWGAMTTDEQDDIIDALYDEIVDCLTGAENAQKAIMSFYRTGADGNPTGQWIIKEIDDKMKNDAYLPDAAASISEILFGFMVNPATTGAGNTGGSFTGGSNNGGSNIRESLELMRSMLKADRQIIYSFFNFFKLYNGIDPAIQLGVQDLELTTLDTGSNTAKVLS